MAVKSLPAFSQEAPLQYTFDVQKLGREYKRALQGALQPASLRQEVGR